MTPHSVVVEVVDAYLDEIDGEMPGLVEGLYLEGSVALGDFQPRSSDIDFIALTTTVPDAATLARLDGIHAWLRARRPRPSFDGIYLTWQDLRHGQPRRPVLCARAG